MDECDEGLAVPVVCARRQCGAAILLHGKWRFNLFAYLMQ